MRQGLEVTFEVDGTLASSPRRSRFARLPLNGLFPRQILAAGPLQGRGRSPRTTRHSTSYATRSYSWRSTLPIPATFDHGISGCLAFRSSLRCRLASEMISIPRSTSQRLRLSNSRLTSFGCAKSKPPNLGRLVLLGHALRLHDRE